MERTRPYHITQIACGGGVAAEGLPNVRFLENSNQGNRLVVRPFVSAKSDVPVGSPKRRVILAALAGVTPWIPTSSTIRSPASAATDVSATALKIRVWAAVANSVAVAC